MGVTYDTLGFFTDTLDKLGWTLESKKICDLGDQVFWGNRVWADVGEVSVRDYFTSKGVDYTSIDLNGNLGALKIDLGKPIKDECLLGKFDIVTDFGTMEHVVEQEVCLDNIDSLVKPGGLMVHTIPDNPKDMHGLYFYDDDWLKNLIKDRGYTLVNELKLDCRQPPQSLEYSVSSIWCMSLLKEVS